MLSSINAFFAFMGWHDLRVKTLKIQRQIFVKVEDELTRSEYKRLLAVARKNGIRQYLLIQTICATGIRVSELKYITAEAVRKCRAEIHMKGKLRIVLLPDKLCKRLRKYAAEQKISGGSIFVTRNGKPVDRTYIWRLMKGLCEAAGVDKRKAFPHNLRHLFARTFYSLEKDIVRLADILGHSSVDTTRIYTRKAGKFAVPICGNWDICFVDEKFSSN